ncbi:MAG: ABC transporter ATP-binding protein [Candidatus Freyarchaeota archaeon]
MKNSQQNNKDIELRNVTVKIRKTTILQDVSFYAKRGEILAIIGGSGAGKSTCLRVLTSQIKPTRGEVHIAGCDATKEGEKLKEILGYVPQPEEVSAYPEFSALKNAYFFGKMYNLPSDLIEKRARQILQILGFDSEEMMKKPFKNLSGGEKKRASICLGLIHNPKVLLLDEPLTGIDAHLRIELLNYLRDLNRQLGVTICIVAHDLETADYSDRIVILDRGRVAIFGEPKRFLRELPNGGKCFRVKFKRLTADDQKRVEKIKAVKYFLVVGRNTLKVFPKEGEHNLAGLVEEFYAKGLEPLELEETDANFGDYFRLFSQGAFGAKKDVFSISFE